MGVNMDSIIGKAKTYMNGDGKNKINNAVASAMAKGGTLGGKSVHTPEEAAAKMLEVLKNAINSHGLSAGVVDAISNWDISATTSAGNGLYYISLNFAGNPQRPSLAPDKYPYGAYNIIGLYNDGVDHTMRPVHGMWHGQMVSSRTNIPAANFINEAVNTFMSQYANEYNVVNVVAHV